MQQGAIVEADERKRVARAYVEYATWFVREGSDKFSKDQEKIREAFAPQFSAISSAIPQGVEALREALRSSADVFRCNLDGLTFEEHPSQWADERVREVINSDGREGWKLIREIVNEATDAEDVLGFIGAGHFENWVSEERVEEVRDEILRSLREDPKVIEVVTSSWDIPPALQEILREVGLWGADGRPTSR
jgi:hypothetical protein